MMTYARVIRVPVVECEVVLHQARQHWYLLLGVIVKDLHRELSLVDIVPVQTQLLVHETLLGRSQLSASDVGIVGDEGAVELDVVAGHSVIRII